MLRYENGFEVTLINTLGIWYALITNTEGGWSMEVSESSNDRDYMVWYADELMKFVGVQRIN